MEKEKKEKIKFETKFEKRSYEYRLFPRISYISCGCAEHLHVDSIIDNKLVKIEEICPTPIKKYILYKIQFSKWIEERKRGMVIREYRNDIFQRAYFRKSRLFVIFNVLTLIKEIM